ncbi:YybH family protein [Crocosphaera watsonii]|uniref:YybH family protein n=1 Tax=Crocosphaera watsonii TaxID=263511 RepID=UPI0009D9FC04|nr:nuclear transport factor 2 family protein [Crocosphaera watsonii]
MKNTKVNLIINPLKLINIFLLICLNSLNLPSVMAQNVEDEKSIELLIEQYNQARVEKDVNLLEKILSTDVDQLVSSGEWRRGIETAIQGMLRSSNRNPGQRTITFEKIRFVQANVAIVDTKYEIKLENNTARNLWSTFIVVQQEGEWKIAAIRNMSPTRQQ